MNAKGRTGGRALAVLLAVLLTLTALCGPGAAQARLSRTQKHFLLFAEQGVASVHRFWWNPHQGWFDARLHDSRRVVTLWEVVPLFEALNGIAIASPTRRHIRNVVEFALGAESYLNPALTPAPGFGPSPGQNSPTATTWFDDNGWWGLAFLDAYQVTGNSRFLGDAETAFRFIDQSGWDSSPGSPGGLWWNTQHTFFAGETFASGTELAARLYAITRNPAYLAEARKFIAWGDTWLWNPQASLYARLRTPQGEGATARLKRTAASRTTSPIPQSEAAKLQASPYPHRPGLRSEPDFDPTPMPYVQGPMIVANQTLCEATGNQAYCARAEGLAGAAGAAFPRLSMGPQYDAVYLRDLLVLYARDRNADWYRIALANGVRALHRSSFRNGLFLQTWSGQASSSVSSPSGSLQLHAATISLFAWLAAIR